MAAFTPLTEAQEKRLAQFEHFNGQCRAAVLRNADARARIWMADAMVRDAPTRRVQAELQARLLRGKADALRQTLDQAATLRWFDGFARRALHDVFGG